MPLHDLFCCSEEYSSNQIITLHFKSYCGCPGVPQACALTNQVLDNHIAAVCVVYHVAENVVSEFNNLKNSGIAQSGPFSHILF